MATPAVYLGNSTGRSAFPAVLMIALLISPFNAFAAPVIYQYSTASHPFGGAGGAIEHFGSDAFVSGTFIYDSEAPQTSTASTGAFNYSTYDSGGGILSSSFTDLTGTVQGLTFSDPRGRTRVASDENTSESMDLLTLQSEPTLYTNLSGFVIDGFSLVNVRFFWLEGQLGISDFLTDNSLPDVLPSFQGRLALDFVPVGTSPPTPDFNQTVFFDGLVVTAAIPEPESYALLGLGLCLIGWFARHQMGRTA